jgi:hypothetical protein
VVQDPPPKLPPGKFSSEFEDFITNWWVYYWYLFVYDSG